MIPMLRTLLRSVVMSTATLVVYLASRVVSALGSPAVVGEGLVGFGHLVGVLAALHRRTETVGRVQDLVHQPLGHGLLATGARVRRQPAQRERCRPARLHL